MPVLIDSGYAGTITWLGQASGQDTLKAEAHDHLDLGFQGLSGARHEGENRPSCVRVKNLYPTGTEIRNVRQISILSQEELSDISHQIALDDLNPGLLGANLILSGIPDFTHVPPSSRLQAPDGTTLTVDMENRPCVLPGREIEQDAPGHGTAFKDAAKGRRGVTAWVERPGQLKIGDPLTLFVPDQRAWAP